VDYSNWTLYDLEQLREVLASEGAGAEEKDAVMREIERRGTPAAPNTRESAVAVAYGDTANSQSQVEREPVGVALRFVAVLIDGAIFFLLGFLLALLSDGTYSSSTAGTHTAGFQVGGRGLVVLALIGLGYYISCEVLFGATLGKLALGLRVVDEQGGPITWGASLVRNVLRIVDGLFFYLVGAIAVWSSPARQRLGDRAAHTYVVRT
jgi:uncharacterized RDD family membrane protein YckC